MQTKSLTHEQAKRNRLASKARQVAYHSALAAPGALAGAKSAQLMIRRAEELGANPTLAKKAGLYALTTIGGGIMSHQQVKSKQLFKADKHYTKMRAKGAGKKESILRTGQRYGYLVARDVASAAVGKAVKEKVMNVARNRGMNYLPSLATSIVAGVASGYGTSKAIDAGKRKLGNIKRKKRVSNG